MDLLAYTKSLGILAVVVLLAGLIFLIRTWPKDIHHTFSQHAATNRAATLYYIGLFTVALSLFALFLFTWFIPFFHIPVVFSVLIMLSLVFQYACTFIPEVGRNVTIHRILAGISGLLLLPSLIVLLNIPTIVVADKIVTLLCVVAMAGIVLSVLWNKAAYALLFQSAYFTAFFVAILSITYW